jgi:histidinol-phosphate aminotransferase
MINEFYKNFRIRDYMQNEGIWKEDTNRIIDCSLGTNPFIKDEFIKKLILKGSCCINKYPVFGYEMLKEELIRFWKDYLYMGVNTENLAFGAGIMGILRNVSQFLIDEKTYILGCSPQFPRFISEVELKKGIYEYYSLEDKNNYEFIVNDFISKITNKYSIISIENPNNPTGQIIDVSDIEKIVIKAKQYDITVIIDEAYGDYMPLENSSIKLVKKYDNVIVLKSASKFLGLPNHRIGYLFADEKFVKVYNEITIPFPFSDLSASIFIEALKNYDKFEYTKKMVIEAKKRILQVINKNNYLYTNLETPIFTIKSDKYENLTEVLMKKGVISESCEQFINLDNRYARIRIPEDYEKLGKILSQVI